MSNYYDWDGNPIDGVMEWAKKCEDPDYKRVALDRVGDKEVSTVWLGLDHNFGNGPPLIFETMVFGDDGEEDVRRYSTKDEAERGHARIVASLRGGRG